MAERDFKGIWIPKEVWLDENLSAIEKVILAEIDSLDRSEQGCTAGNEYLADFCQCSVPTVTRAIKKLTDYGYLRLQSFDGRHRELKSCLIKMIRQTTQNDEADTSKRLAINTDNNTSTNSKGRKKDGYARLINEYTDDEDLKQALFDFIAMRQMIKKPMSDQALKQLFTKLDNLTPSIDEQVQILQQSIFHNWQSVYPLKEESRQMPVREQAPKTVGVHFESERSFDDDDDIYFDPAR